MDRKEFIDLLDDVPEIFNDTWCFTCNQADLGMIEPKEYEEAGEVFVEGKCRKCGNKIVTQIQVEKYEETNE
jgi:hypothetical protein